MCNRQAMPRAKACDIDEWRAGRALGQRLLRIAEMFERHNELLAKRHLGSDRLATANATLRDLERLWTEALHYPVLGRGKAA